MNLLNKKEYKNGEVRFVNVTAIEKNAALKIVKHSHDLRNAELNIAKLRQD